MKGRTFLNIVLFLTLVSTAVAGWQLGERDVRKLNYDFLPESQMAYSPAYPSLSPNPNFPDGLTERPPPAGTIARGFMPLHYQATPEDAVRAGRELKNPFQETDAVHRERGSVVYTNYCQVCHGPLGQGNGPITRGAFPPPASLMANRAVQMKDGQMFHVLTYGQGNMPAFTTQLSRDDRWNAILHIRMLQGGESPQLPQTHFQEIAKVFRANCSACHGEDGSGGTVRKALPLIPDFTSVAWQVSQTEIAIVNQIEFGSHPMMPAFRYKLPQDQILGLAVYIRSFAAHPGAGTAAAPAPSHLTAKSIYGTFCFACHDTNGKGNSTMRAAMPEIPDFTGTPWQKSRTDAEIAHSILQGKGKFMLPMTDKLGAVDVKQMVALIRGFEGGKQVVPLEEPKLPGPPPPLVPSVPVAVTPSPFVKEPTREPLVGVPGDTAARVRIGASIFQQYCIVCHGPDGTGSIMRQGPMPAIPNFRSAVFHKERSDAQIRVSILDGKGVLMPANRGRVTEEQASDLVAYLRSFAGIVMTQPVRTSDANFEKKYGDLTDQWNRLQEELKKLQEKK